MNIKVKKLVSILTMCMMFCLSLSAFAITKADVKAAGQKTVNYYYKTAKANEFKGLMDWPALGLYGFGEEISSSKWTTSSGKNAAYWRAEQVKKGVGLVGVKNTDYQRTIIGVTAAGKDPRNFGGINLVEIEKGTMLPNGHFADSAEDRKTKKPVGNQLVNAHIFGIIAMHVAGEPIPNRDKAAEWLLKQQLPDGGFTWDVKVFDNPEDYELVDSDIDMTAAGLMGLAILKVDKNTPEVQKALKFLKEKQLESGGFHSWGTENPESCAWVIQALTLYGEDPMGKAWTQPSGGNPVSALLQFQLDNGSFTHVLDKEDDLPIYENGMSTEQALYGMADAYNGKAAYDMLYEGNKAKAMGLLFKDLKTSDFAFKEIMDLAYDYVVIIDNTGYFKPNEKVTKAEVCKTLVRALKIQTERGVLGSQFFKDVDSGNEHNKYIGMSKKLGFVSTNKAGMFYPNNSITGEQLCALVVKAMNRGAEAEKLTKAAKNAGWSYGAIKIATDQGLLFEGFNPKKEVTRAELCYVMDKLYKK